MPTLASDLRNKLERVVIEARDAAEVGARAALEALAVHHHEPYPHMKPAQRQLRNHLRARARQLGDQQDKTGRIAIQRIVHECAYEHWHRMLFARFLAENGLLIEPDDNMAISLAEAEELAKEEGVDVWVYASRCAQRMLPQIFRPDDPLLQVAFATEHMLKLEKLLASLPAAVFTASDALGWVYQFWQSKKKDEVNRSEVKIGADELPVVTQLFTEPYMVEFLLHNTLGAWWAGKKLTTEATESAETEEELRRKVSLPGVTWDYLRFVRDSEKHHGDTEDTEKTTESSSLCDLSASVVKSGWRPAAGTFDGWPKAAKDIKVLDPCCGSGHFLVAALHHLVPIRMAEEGLSAADAVDAVLRDNLHGLEIDERCCQIAAFALALAAWTYPNAGGYRPLPELHIACTGIGPQCSADQWITLAEQSGIPMPSVGREAIKNGLLNLHRLFSQAPTLGSLINPAELPADLIAADYETIQPYLAAVLKAEKADDETHERAIAAAGMVKAADLLSCEYTLVITNVPYLGREKQNDLLRDRFADHHPEAKADLACVMLERCLDFASAKGNVGIVSPQYWLFLPRYKKFRVKVLKSTTCGAIAKLGPGAFETITGEVVNASLSILCPRRTPDTLIHVVDSVSATGTAAKAEQLRNGDIECLKQQDQLLNPDAVIGYSQGQSDDELLSDYAYCYQGLATSDNSQFLIGFWEVPKASNGWVHFQMSPGSTRSVDGYTWLLHWEDGSGRYHRHAQALKSAGRLGGWKSGHEAWGSAGIAINRMGDLPVCLYSGAMFDCNVAVLIPSKTADLPWLWSYLSSPDYAAEVRRLNQKTCVTNLSLVKVPANKAHWQKVAAEKYPNGLPEPESDDPTQWLFHGHPYEAQEDTMLQVAVARLLGYRWPAELDPDMRLSKRARGLVMECEKLLKFADEDGIVCIPAVRGEEPAAEQLLALLTACDIEPGVDLDDWLRNQFFEEHCKLFHDRPFVWHIWDGRKRDGFHALVNYHKLCEGGGKGRRLLESLTYAYLGEWITRQKDGVKRGEGGAEDRLAAALELQKRLEAILAGEPPFDIFVRWKKLSEQPIGWEPDINDGVRMNIRPFLASDLPKGPKGAGVLRCRPNIKWTKDRGKEPERPKAEYPWFWNWDEKTPDFMGTGKEPDGNRHNDCHYTNKTKQAARDAAKKGSR
jgi:hypothetical protein